MDSLRLLDRIAAVLPLAIVLLPIPIAWLLFRGRGLQSDRVDKQAVRGAHRRVFEIAFWVANPCGLALARLGLSADAVSLIALACGVSAGALIALGWFGFAAMLLFVAGFLDVLDGIVARAHGTSGPAGAVLDSFLDRPVDFSWHAGAAFLWREAPLLMFVALAAAHGSFVLSYTSMLAEKHDISVPRGVMKRTERGPLLLLGTCLATWTGGWEAAHGLPAATPLLLVTALIALGANGSAIWRLTALRRALRG